eukprot:g60889.t1
MELIANYRSDDESDEEKKQSDVPTKMLVKSVNPTPMVAEDLHEGQLSLVNISQKKELLHNPTAEEMWAEVQGPQHPKRQNLGMREGITMNNELGFVEKDVGMDDAIFEEQYHNFKHQGWMESMHNSGQKIKGEKLKNPERADLLHLPPDTTASTEDKDKSDKGEKAEEEDKVDTTNIPRWKKGMKKVKRKKVGVDDVESWQGSWASVGVDDVESWQGSWASVFEGEKDMQLEKTEEQKAVVAAQKAKRQKPEHPQEPQEGEDTEEKGPNCEEVSQFHGEELYDYQGRSYVHPPSELVPGEHKCFIPKKKIHTWSGHQGGVNKIAFIPNYGHLLLSASMDSTIKIWSTQGQRQCLRTYMGHGQSVRDVVFSEDGTRFVSISYDRYVKQWDTETGQVISRHTSGAIPYCVNMNPKHQTQVLCGQANKLVVQWDLRINNLMQKYNEHLGPVNSVTFVDNDRRFVSTADDKKIFVWEYGLPVVVKHISEPDLHSMPTMAKSAQDKFAIANSNDNQVVLFQSLNRFKMNRKKRFTGHLVSGYACQLGFSPDIHFVYSGDAQGRVFFWDFKTTKVLRVLKAHDKVCNGVIWHPIHPSKFATCSWDGTIKILIIMSRVDSTAFKLTKYRILLAF